ncbi:reverse transcriptase [Gossypium australe]|uniref:Reverse transcriptase n=1 Tax=Gossypium australe TaxID=47621 RepID=A0A5B6WX71_9ROSI|nr:reverse transcriptase [Gossypium australe]
MDFVSGLPLTPTKKDSVWVIVDRLTKFTHFIPVHTDYSLQKLAKLYVAEIVRLHRVLVSIISDRDPRLTSRFWKVLHETLGTRLDFNTAFHPQTDGQSERMALYKALYGRRCRTPTCWIELSERQLLGPELISKIEEKVKLIRVSVEEIEVRPDLTFEEEPVQILDRDIKVLRRKFDPLVKVLWRNHGSEEATWEPEEAI